MVEYVGLTGQEERQIKGMVERLGGDQYRLCGLKRIEKVEMPGYHGKVVPARVGECGLHMTMYLSSLGPFTIAHELAHVSDMAVRRSETIDNIGMAMPTHWHLAHRMSAEYYANRVACDYADEREIFAAFQSDSIGLRVAAREQDWGSFLIYYSLLLGIFHGMGKMEHEPLKALSPFGSMPQAVVDGMAEFKRHATDFFENYGAGAFAMAA